MSYYTTDSLVKVRLRMVEIYLKEGKTSHQVPELFGISRKTFFKWLKKYREYGIEGLVNRKSGAKKNERKTSSSIEELVVKLRLDTPFWSRKNCLSVTNERNFYLSPWRIQCFKEKKPTSYQHLKKKKK